MRYVSIQSVEIEREELLAEIARISAAKDAEIEKWKTFAKLCEQRSRDIRRVAELEHAELEKVVGARPHSQELEQLRAFRARVTASRAHELADFYIREAHESSPRSWLFRMARPFMLRLARWIGAFG